MARYIFILFFLLQFYIPVFAHSDAITICKIGRVKTFVQWGFNEHEERNKALIISRLADSLIFDLKFDHDIRIRFKHLYGSNEANYASLRYIIEPKYTLSLVSYDKLPREISLSINCYEFDTEETLKLLDYAIKNFRKLKKENPEKITTFNFKEFNYDYYNSENKTGEKPYIERLYHSESFISYIKVLTILQQPASKTVKKVMEKKVYRPLEKNELTPTEGISYYMQNGKYYIFHRFRDYINNSSKDSIVLVLNSIFQFESKKNYDRAIVFDSYCSFYCIDKFNNNFLSKRQIIPDLKSFFYPFDVQFPGHSIIAISKSQSMGLERNFIYRIKDDLLIPDLDKLLDNFKKSE